MKKLHIILVALMMTSLGFSQSHVFSILANKGSNQVKKGTNWNTLSTGSKVYKGNSIKVVAGGYIGLMHKTGKTIELRTAGEYSVASLEGKLKTSSSSYAERYTRFATNMNGSEGAKYKYNATGSVDRGVGYDLLTQDTIEVIKEIPLTIAWSVKGKSANDRVELRIVNLFDETLVKSTGKNSSAVLDLTKVTLPGADELIVANLFDPLSDKGESLIKKATQVHLVEATKAKKVLAEYNKLVAELDLNSPLDNMVLASFFAEHGLVSYASSHLYRAASLAPEVTDYEGAFYSYLEKEGVVTKAQKK